MAGRRRLAPAQGLADSTPPAVANPERDHERHAGDVQDHMVRRQVHRIEHPRQGHRRREYPTSSVTWVAAGSPGATSPHPRRAQAQRHTDQSRRVPKVRDQGVTDHHGRHVGPRDRGGPTRTDRPMAGAPQFP